MNTLTSVNAWLGGFFACAAIHYAVYWWRSRKERILLVFSVQCGAYTAFCQAIVSYFWARTVPDTQAALDRFVTIGVLVHALTVQFYATLGGRRDRVFRAFLTAVIVFLAVLNQWAPLRGTVVELQTVQLPGGATSLVPIRTPAGASLVLLYLVVLVVQGYGFFVAHSIWKRDRAGSVLLAAATALVLAGAVLGFLIDFLQVRAPYVGAWPHAIFVVCVAIFLSREYSARGARVAAAKRQFEAAFEHGPIGKALVTLDGHFLKVNRALCRILGWTDEELCARGLGDVMHKDDGSGEPRQQRRGTYTAEKRFLRKDGEPVWALLAISAIPDDRGQPVHLIAQVQDVTELRAHREKLEELVATRTRELSEAKDVAERASQAKSQFLAHMSHEMRNPLHAMLAYAQSLERDRGLNEAQRTKVGIVRSSGKHLQALINDVLEMSKIEAGRAELAPDVFDPWQTLIEVERMFAAEAAAKGIELTLVRASELPRSLLGDGAKVKQIVINLTSNALKFTKQGSVRLEASARPFENGSIRVEVRIADTGIGIAARDTARMFQPFEQLDAGKRAGGTGLGLAISLAYARLMSGDVTVQSVPGAGSTFTLTYVAKRCAPTETTEAAETTVLVAPGTAHFKALIVDDVAINRDILAELLSGRGFETRTAADGAHAVSLHSDWRPELVLLDLRMPGMGGLEAIRRIRASGSRAAIGALTASTLEEDERQALAMGADFFIRKPYDYEELLVKIESVLQPATRDMEGRVVADPSVQGFA